MSPEQAQDPRHVDFRADMYSLGCTLYFLLTGRAPFQSDDNDSIASKLLAHIEKDVPPITTYRQDIPKPICQLVEQMLAKSPEDRPASYDFIIHKFEPLAANHRLAELTRDKSKNSAGASIDRSSAVTSTTYADKLRDWAINTALCLLGFQDAVPGKRPGQKTTYQTSFRWIRNLVMFLIFGTIFWFIASNIEFVEYSEIE
jgi:serine/threonine protein kinase